MNRDRTNTFKSFKHPSKIIKPKTVVPITPFIHEYQNLQLKFKTLSSDVESLIELHDKSLLVIIDRNIEYQLESAINQLSKKIMTSISSINILISKLKTASEVLILKGRVIAYFRHEFRNIKTILHNSSSSYLDIQKYRIVQAERIRKELTEF